MDDVANTELAAGFQPDALTSPPIHVRTSVKAIAEDVARWRGDVTVDEIFGRCRVRRIARARQEVMFWARQAGMSNMMTARRFPNPDTPSGHIDPSTVQNGVTEHEKRRRKSILARIARDNELSAIRHRRAA